MKRFLGRSYRSMTNLEERKEEEKKKSKVKLGGRRDGFGCPGTGRFGSVMHVSTQ
jgi:hypothetical protein